MATITRAEAETVLLRRCAAWMESVEMDYQTNDGTNADLNDPLGTALRWLGKTVTEHANISDADLSGISSAQVAEMLDIAELRLLESIQRNFAAVDVEITPYSEKFGQLGRRLDRVIEGVQAACLMKYGYGQRPDIAGIVSVRFQQDADDTDDDGL